MNFLKKIAYMLTLSGMAFGLAACSNDNVEYEPAAPVEGAQVYFSTNNISSVNATMETTSFEVVVMRGGDTEEAVNVPIKAVVSVPEVEGEEADSTDPASLFTIPTVAKFAAGKDTVKLTIDIDRENLADGQTYTIALTLNDLSVVTPYGNSSLTVSVVVPQPLKLLGTGYWVDDIVGPLFGLNITTYPVEVYENLKTPGYIYLKDLYTNAYKQTLVDEFGIDEASIPTWDESYFAIDITDPAAVAIPGQYTGLDIGYGDMAIWSLSTGTLENGIISFPAKGLAVQDNDGAYYANNNGATMLYMPGTPMTDFSLELAYGGFRVAEDNATVYPIARAAYGEDVAEILYAFVAGDITKDAEALAAALAGIEDGSIVSNQVAVTSPGKDEETGEPILEMTLESVEGAEAGMFTAIAICVHNFPEGIATFLTATQDVALGVSVALAIAIHNIPEGIAVALPIYHVTGKKRYAMLYAALSGLSEPVGALVGLLIFSFLLPQMLIGVIMAAVAGIMIYLAFDTLLPLAKEYGDWHLSLTGIISGILFIWLGLIIIG